VSASHKQALAAGFSGLLFGVGLVISGMTDPNKVLGFLDVFGAWDGSLMWVMAGAIGVHAVAYRWIRRRPAPLFDAAFRVPTRRDLDGRLLLGAAVFGVGWGLGGYCPGPSVVSLASLRAGVVVFVAALAVGSIVTAKLEARFARRDHEVTEATGVTAESRPGETSAAE
jgi:uncharacterized membrane protein YedE/YeeE